VKRAAFLLLIFVAASAHAWTVDADRRIASSSAKLSPPGLLLVIKAFNRDYARGIEQAKAEEAAGGHGDLRQRIDTETRNVITMLKSNQSMTAVVERLGVLAHLVGDANNPYRVKAAANGDDFEVYFGSRVAKFPTVFYGAEPRLKVDRTLARAASLAPLLDEEYERGSSASFDDHSTAFGVASVCYSHAVTDTANLFTYIWREAGGVVLNASTN
jgi:hypothetical protein